MWLHAKRLRVHLAQVTIVLLKNAMIRSGGSVFLIDGFPRAMDQVGGQPEPGPGFTRHRV